MTAAQLPPSACPGCGCATNPSHLHPNQPSLCLACTEDELGETYEELRDRISAKRKKKRKWQL